MAVDDDLSGLGLTGLTRTGAGTTSLEGTVGPDAMTVTPGAAGAATVTGLPPATITLGGTEHSRRRG